MLRIALAIVLAGDAVPAPRPGDLIWKTSATVEKGGDETFVTTGTRAGQRYLFRARGICKLKPGAVWLGVPFGWRERERKESIFGIDFRVVFGSGDPRMMQVGDGKVDRTELVFVADRDDTPIRIVDHWELPKDVTCTIDNIEVVAPPPASD